MNRVVSATEFKAKCLALLDEVNESGDTLTITKRGKAVATVQPAPRKPWVSLKGAWEGKFLFEGDIAEEEYHLDWNFERRAKDLDL